MSADGSQTAQPVEQQQQPAETVEQQAPAQQIQQPQPVADGVPQAQQQQPMSHNFGGGPTNVLRMRGLPYSVTEEDVRAFFSSFDLDGPDAIVLITQGFHRGEGYARFVDPAAASLAQSNLNRQNIGERYIELYPSTEPAMEIAKQQQIAMGNTKNTIIRLRGLPFQATEMHISEFFGDIQEQIAAINLCINVEGRTTGDAFVEITTPEAAQLAMAKNRQLIGQRYIEIFDSTPHERDILLTSARRGRGRGRGGMNMGGMQYGNHMGMMMGGGMMNPMHMGMGRGRGGGGGGYGPYASPMMQQEMMMQQMNMRPPSQFIVRVRGLPFSANEATIAEFFSDVNIPPQGVHMVFNSQERPTGEAFVEVCAEDDVQRAMAHSGAALGHRYIEVFRSSEIEMQRLGGGLPPQFPFNAPPPPPPPQDQQQQQPQQMQMQNAPMQQPDQQPQQQQQMQPMGQPMAPAPLQPQAYHTGMAAAPQTTGGPLPPQGVQQVGFVAPDGTINPYSTQPITVAQPVVNGQVQPQPYASVAAQAPQPQQTVMAQPQQVVTAQPAEGGNSWASDVPTVAVPVAQ